jgi:CRISPR-associated protein Csd1
MGLLQQAALTYDCHSALAGEVREGHEILAPVSHLVTRADLEVTLDRDGTFVSARKVEKTEPKILIPATEESGGRTVNLAPHPLCDQLKYIAPYHTNKYTAYLKQLSQWEQSADTHPKLKPILAYVAGGTILDDLTQYGLISCSSKGIPENEKQLVRWVVLDANEGQPNACWLDKSLFQSFMNYEIHQREKRKKSLCMVSGTMSVAAGSHPKGIVSLNGNAKLISANDKTNYTYRGRFSDEFQAATVSYAVSQKAHNALRWLVAEQHVYFGGRAFLCWNPQGKRIPNPTAALAFLGHDLPPAVTPSAYQQQLEHTLYSFRQDNQLTGNETVVIAAFDAATPGRLALTDYCEQQASVFLSRLHNWDAQCNWENGRFGIQSPSLFQIVSNAFGAQRLEKGSWKMTADDRVCRQQMQRLMDCKLSAGQRISPDIVRVLTQRASAPQAYERNIWLNILFTACAVIKKYRHDQYKEEWTVALDTNNTNRSYLFGRLLAIAEKVERDTYGAGEERETNALRMQTIFSRRPLYAWRILEEKLNPYYSRLTSSSRQYYKRLTGEIVTALEDCTQALDRPLEDVYLLGYYSQRQAFYKKNDKTHDETTEE